MNKNVRRWYVKTYPTDSFGKRINPEITFSDVLLGMMESKDVYDIISAGDSIVRERIFGEMSRVMGCGYDRIYNIWMESNRRANQALFESLNKESF